jgi:thioredoxin 1
MTIINYYSADWCKNCKPVTPILEEIARENPTVQFRYIDTEYALAEMYNNGVRSVPTVIIKKDGVETARFVGIQSKSTYEAAIK